MTNHLTWMQGLASLPKCRTQLFFSGLPETHRNARRLERKKQAKLAKKGGKS